VKAALLLTLLLAGCATLPHPTGPDGDSWRDPRLLDPDPAVLRIELDRIAGSEPRPRALAIFLRQLRKLTHKERIELVVDDRIAADDYEGTHARVRFLAARHRGQASDGRADIHLLYAPRLGNYRGYAWTRREMARRSGSYRAPLVTVYVDTLKPIAHVSGVIQEASVLVHETGHAFGLATNPGHSMDGHCTNAWCSLYDGVDARSGLLYLWPTLLSGYLPIRFCADCRADLFGRPELPRP
jgi:hypothetical protein